MPEAGDIYDCLIIGGGPAGLSAAVYMGRFLRKTLVLDASDGRSSFAQVNENYLGFPEGISVRELRELGRRQAERFDVEFQECQVTQLERHAGGHDFIAHTIAGQYQARTVILCTGVRDIWPDFPNVCDYVGKTLFWCITCDGFRSLGKRLVLFGNDDEAATTACQFKLYTNEITFVAKPGEVKCSDEKLCAMRDNTIEFIEGEPAELKGTTDSISAVILKDGRRLEADLVFSLLGARPNSKLAADLGAKRDRDEYVVVDEEGYTSVRGLFCAGDLSRMHTHQVVAAAHEGAEAAQTANYYLYARYQKNTDDQSIHAPEKVTLRG